MLSAALDVTAVAAAVVVVVTVVVVTAVVAAVAVVGSEGMMKAHAQLGPWYRAKYIHAHPPQCLQYLKQLKQ